MPPVAETIASVVSDLRNGRILHVSDCADINAIALSRAKRKQPVIDATRLYREVAAKEEFRPYDDYPCCVSPWENALFAYENTHGNILVAQVHQHEANVTWDTGNEVDWGRVKWIVETILWAGGYSRGKRFPTNGPLFIYRHALYETGEPADVQWTAILPDSGEEDFTIGVMTVSAALNFLNCSNVESVTPRRPHPVRKRLREARVDVQEIVVRPPGKRTEQATGGREADQLDVPLTCVRGHFARYGPEYGRGLLFGKYSGRFWRPARASGAQKNYVLKP